MTEVFGKYELVRRLGVGGMAEVFLARLHGAEGFIKHLVIKRILPAFNEDPEFVRMFVNEARLASRLQHANIVQIFDFDHVEGAYYIAMEWIDGLDLRRVLLAASQLGSTVPLTLAVQVGLETLKGLHYAHCLAEGGQPLGIVHRDVSPHNLLVSFSGEVKIADFGIAKVAAMASATRAGVVKGKLRYMAPEQLSGEGVDRRTDLFALGVVLWETLAGRRLYQADNEARLIELVRQADSVPSLGGIRADVPEELEQVICRLLAAKPEERFASAADALRELSPFGAAGDTLEVARLLQKLAPAESQRQQRGGTIAAPMYREAEADASTAGGGAEAPSVRAPATASTDDEHAPAHSLATAETAVDTDSGASDAPTAVDHGASTRTLVPGAASSDIHPPKPVESMVIADVSTVQQPVQAKAAAEVSKSPEGPFEDAPVATSSAVTSFGDTASVGSAERSIDVSDASVGQGTDLSGAAGTKPRYGRLKLLLAATVILIGGWVASVWLWRPLPNSSPSEASAVAASPVLGSDRALLSTDASSVAGLDTGTTPVADAGVQVADVGGEQDVLRQSPHQPPKALRRRLTRRTRKYRRHGRPRPRAAATPVTWGALTVTVWPWATVKVDGKLVGNTPVVGHRLSAGRHLVQIYNPQLKRTERREILIQGGKTTSLSRRW